MKAKITLGEVEIKNIIRNYIMANTDVDKVMDSDFNIRAASNGMSIVNLDVEVELKQSPRK